MPMMCDLGVAMKLAFVIDAKATEHILHRQESARLSLQDTVRSDRLLVRRVKNERHVADLGAMALGRAVIARHPENLRVRQHAEQQQQGSYCVNMNP